MPIEMPRGLPFSVDTWSPSSSRKRYHFLSHAHSDHLAGIAAHAAFPIYASRVTRSLVVHRNSHVDTSLFVDIEVGERVVFDDPEGEFFVTAFDANHCPGALMFLFEGKFGNILHTGDCRLTPDCLQYIPLKYLSRKGREDVSHLDYLFLDCTFGRCVLDFPSKECAIQQVINCIWKHPSAPTVYLACDLLGQEDILVAVSKAFGCKIFVDKSNNSECYQALLVAAPQILSEDVSSRFQVVEGFPRLSERASERLADARANHQPEPLFIRPSAQWYATNDYSTVEKRKAKVSEAERDEYGVWHVCYSIHSSREELDWALKLLRPKWVISTTPPCRAMELDYVKKHCFKTQITSDDPLWKLLNIRTAKATSPSPQPRKVLNDDRVPESLPLKESNTNASLVEVATYAECNEVKSKNSGVYLLQNLELPSPSKAPPVTLFGRARFGLPDHYVVEDAKSEFPISKNEAEVSSAQRNTVLGKPLSLDENTYLPGKATLKVHTLSLQENAVDEPALLLSQENNLKQNIQKQVEQADVSSISKLDATKLNDVNLRKDETYAGSSRSYNTSLRRQYRSMNVPVPRPLPSLVELMNSSKRVKVSSESSYSSLKHCSEYVSVSRMRSSDD